MNIWCCGCACYVDATLVTGAEVYPHRPDLRSLPFWRCPTCANYVGCHHKTADSTKPLGVIPTPEIRNARLHIHALVDPVWKSGRVPRGKLYATIGSRLGRAYHTAEIRTVHEAREVYRVAQAVIAECKSSPTRPAHE